MKNISYIIISCILLIHCSPKNANIVTAPPAPSEIEASVVEIVTDKNDFRKKPPMATAAPTIKLGESTEFELENGLKVIVVENHKLPRVAYRIFVDYDPVKEGSKAGMIDLATSLLDKGTATRTKSEIDETIDFVGASLFTNSNGLGGSCLTKHSDVLLTVIQDVLLNPSFPESEFEKSRKQTISGLKSYTTDPDQMSNAVGATIAFGSDHPYGEMATEQTVHNVELSDLKDFYQSRYKPNISYLVVVGDIDASKAKEQAEKYFSDWKRGEVENYSYDDPSLPIGTKVSFVDKPSAVQSVINVTYPLDLKNDSPDVIKSSVMATLLGGYFGSRLNENLREDKAFTYGARARLNSDQNVGSFKATASVRNEVTDSSLTELLYELDRIVTEPVSQSELDMTKSVMAGRFARSLEDPQVIARFALNTARFGLPKDYYANYLTSLDGVSVDDVQSMAGKYLKPKNANIVVVGNQDEVAEKLAKFSHDGKVDYYTPFAEVKEVSNEPLDITGEQVISNYLEAIGGVDKIKSVKDVKIIAKAEVRGQALTIEDYWQSPNKGAKLVSMAGQIVNSQVYDGQSAQVSAMGQSKKVEGDDLKDLDFRNRFIPEAYYDELGLAYALKGLEDVGGKSAYKIVLTLPSGASSTEYFDKESGLKLRTISSQEGTTVTVDYADYMSYDGILLPKSNVVTGLMPVPLDMQIQEVLINKGMDEGLFKIGP